MKVKNLTHQKKNTRANNGGYPNSRLNIEIGDYGNRDGKKKKDYGNRRYFKFDSF